MKNLQPSVNNQKGMATVLIVLLVGVSMTAIALGLAGSVKSSQQTQTAVHAVTHAQSAAWAAVHMFQDYLDELDFEDVEQLTADSDVPINVSNMHQALAITIVEVDTSKKSSEGIFVTANIRAHDSSADSTSIIQVVYQVENTVCDLCQVLNATIDLFDDTNLGGDITIATPPGVSSTVNVEGDVSALNIAFNGVTRLNATGDVTLGSAIPLQEVYTNSSLVLDGSANVGKASALGTIITRNNGYANLMYANQAISLGGGAVPIANSRSNITITNWAIHGELHAGGNVSIASPVQKVRAKGNVQQTQWADARDIETEGDMTCPSDSWSMFDRIRAAVSTTNCPTSGDIQAGATVNVAVMDELTPFEQVKPRIDAWAVKGEANYAFEYVLGKIKVTVKNVNTVADGVYFLGDYPDGETEGYRDYLCDAVDAGGQCTAPATPYKTVCNSFTTTNNCITYDNLTKTWRIDGRNLPPGTAWFDGNLTLSNGRYYNTFVTTGDLLTSNDHETAVPNYIGYSAICENDYPQYPSSRFADMYPLQLCDATASEMIYDPMANVAYLAGGFDPNAGGVYKGGNINLTASNAVYGTILAGNNLDTLGDIRVYGYISATAQNAVKTSNDLGGRTIIDISNLPATYRPQEVPDFDGESCTSVCNPPVGGPKVLWTRYL